MYSITLQTPAFHQVSMLPASLLSPIKSVQERNHGTWSSHVLPPITAVHP